MKHRALVSSTTCALPKGGPFIWLKFIPWEVKTQSSYSFPGSGEEERAMFELRVDTHFLNIHVKVSFLTLLLLAYWWKGFDPVFEEVRARVVGVLCPFITFVGDSPNHYPPHSLASYIAKLFGR